MGRSQACGPLLQPSHLPIPNLGDDAAIQVEVELCVAGVGPMARHVGVRSLCFSSLLLSEDINNHEREGMYTPEVKKGRAQLSSLQKL